LIPARILPRRVGRVSVA